MGSMGSGEELSVRVGNGVRWVYSGCFNPMRQGKSD